MTLRVGVLHVPVFQAYLEMPPVTRVYTTACVMTTIAVSEPEPSCQVSGLEMGSSANAVPGLAGYPDYVSKAGFMA